MTDNTCQCHDCESDDQTIANTCEICGKNVCKECTHTDPLTGETICCDELSRIPEAE